jgi:hypothetical protein
MTGQDFERSMVHAFNGYAETYCKKLVAYRHLQIRYQPQLFDVLVDSRPNEFYLALECKSIDVDSVKQIYFKKHFNWKNGICQITRENDWLSLSGRNGFLAVELRGRLPFRTRCFLVPWRVVYNNFSAGYPGIVAEVVCSCPCCIKSGGKYTFDDEFVEAVISQIDSYPKSGKKAYRPKWNNKRKS